LKIQALHHRFAPIEPVEFDWRYAREIRVEFCFERPQLSNLKEVSPAEFRAAFISTRPVFVEKDSPCAGNEGKRSPGGWGAAIVQGTRICKRWGAKGDTSNNEMEYEAMLSAMELIPAGSYVCIETDSQGYIDGFTKHRRWEKQR
jgi:hypothetical protein